jgi:hypothetical protein
MLTIAERMGRLPRPASMKNGQPTTDNRSILDTIDPLSVVSLKFGIPQT